MAEAFRTWGAVVLATLVALPFAAALVALLARRRVRAGASPRWAWRCAVAEVGMVVGTIPWIWMILTPRAAPGRLELIPLRGLVSILGGDPGVAVVQVGGNLLVFAAFGLFAPVRWPIGAATVAAYAAAGSVVVETLQYALHLGRVSSTDDVALNTLGAVLAALCSYRWWRRRASTSEDSP
jgi:glycopeptide antibiotics resistance protein